MKIWSNRSGRAPGERLSFEKPQQSSDSAERKQVDARCCQVALEALGYVTSQSGKSSSKRKDLSRDCCAQFLTVMPCVATCYGEPCIKHLRI